MYDMDNVSFSAKQADNAALSFARDLGSCANVMRCTICVRRSSRRRVARVDASS